MECAKAMAKTASREQTRNRLGRSSRLSDAPPKAESKSLNRSLHAAKAAKQDEFYTQYVDIEKEVEAYLEFDPDTFRGKVVYCNCDDPFESNFFKYFAANFNKLGLKKLITTSYDGSPIAGQMSLFPEYSEGNGKRQKPKALCVILDHVKDEDGDGATNIEDVKLFLKRNKAARTPLKADDQFPGGDFRSTGCVELLKQADIVVTNPPFSLFHEYVAQLVAHEKRFLIIGNKNWITYKEFFPLIKDGKLWMGVTPMSVDMLFDLPPKVAEVMLKSGKKGSNYRVVNGKVMGRSASVWFTNLDHGRRHQRLPLMTMEENLKFSKHKEVRGKKVYDRYDNYDAIEVPFTDAIPSDLDGVMGVPISFLDKYNPEQFEIVGTTESNDPDNACRTRLYTSKECRAAYLKRFGEPGTYDLNASGVVKGVKVFKRILIRRRANGKKK